MIFSTPMKYISFTSFTPTSGYHAWKRRPKKHLIGPKTKHMEIMASKGPNMITRVAVRFRKSIYIFPDIVVRCAIYQLASVMTNITSCQSKGSLGTV